MVKSAAVKRYLFECVVKSVHGVQTFYVDAVSRGAAERVMKSGGGELYASEVEVTDVGEPEFAGETTKDDFGGVR